MARPLSQNKLLPITLRVSAGLLALIRARGAARTRADLRAKLLADCPPARRVFLAVAENYEADTAKLCTASGLTPPQVHGALVWLRKKGLVEPQGRGWAACMSEAKAVGWL